MILRSSLLLWIVENDFRPRIQDLDFRAHFLDLRRLLSELPG